MCAIFGYLNTPANTGWLNEQTEKALLRGKDLTHLTIQGMGNMYHTRLATNTSADTYPIHIGGDFLSMNGIVSEGHYKQMREQYKGLVEGYSVDSAYMLAALRASNNDFSLFDSLDFVFALWLYDGISLYLANKDYPLFVQYTADGGLRFSSFAQEGFSALGNTAISYNLHTRDYTIQYKYQELVYGV